MFGQKQTMDELKLHGLEVIESARKIKNERPMISVQVDVKLDADPGLKDIRLTWKTQRGTMFHAHDFKFEGGHLLTFSVSTELPEPFAEAYADDPSGPMGSIFATIFTDFCWKLAEGTTPKTLLEVDTPVRSDAKLGDLTWLLPSKFADDLIEVLHVLNMSVLEGFMQNSVLYGTYLIAPAA